MTQIPDTFVTWVVELVTADGFAARERTHKITASERFQALLDAGLNGDDIFDWLARRTGGVTDRFTMRSLASVPRDELERETKQLLADGDLRERLDRFGAWMRSAAKCAEGEQTAIASALLMGANATEFPPHRTRVIGRALQLAGRPKPSGPPSQRYGEFLDFCDEIIEAVRAQGQRNLDRLDVQGACWIMGSWSPEDVAKLIPEGADAFEHWRGNSPPDADRSDEAGLRDFERSTPIWWVNQGATYKPERDGGFVWAPKVTKSGYPMGHHTAVSRIRRGDTIVHYAKGHIRAVSTAVSDGHDADRPGELPDEAWNTEGHRADCQYYELTVPIPLAAIDEDIRRSAGGPFTSIGSVQQGYLFELDDVTGAVIGDLLEASQYRMIEVTPSVEADTSPVEPKALLEVADAFIEATSAAGLSYGARHETLIRSFISALATKPFVILTGLSGSGKTRLAQAFGHWIGAINVVAVRPDWTSPDALLGFENALSEPVDGFHSWNVPDTLRFILDAHHNPTVPHLLLLDEMNLAHVERYFADVLSGMESGEPVVPNLTRGDDGLYRRTPDTPEALPLPANLFVVGTVNIDETTYMFSPKVLDRANTFEFRVTTDDLVTTAPPAIPQPAEAGLAQAFLRAAQTQGPLDDELLAECLRDVHAILSEADREFGYRTFQEAMRFADFLKSVGEADRLIALDLQIAQKVLPRLHGSRRELAGLLDRLGGFCHFGPTRPAPADFQCVEHAPSPETALPISYAKLHRMAKKLQANHFVSFAE